jgi:hypothetical protein
MGKHSVRRDYTPVKRAVFTTVAVAGLLGGTATAAFADPDFGPGNSAKGPQDAGALCHPPGQTTDFPACK